MNNRIIKLGLDSHMLNYIDNETPRHYFLSAHADEDDLQKFAELIIHECAVVAIDHMELNEGTDYGIGRMIKEHFGVEE